MTLRRKRVRCVCRWPSAASPCPGSGRVNCEGCDGEGECLCVCGGERACPGCAACEGATEVQVRRHG